MITEAYGHKFIESTVARSSDIFLISFTRFRFMEISYGTLLLIYMLGLNNNCVRDGLNLIRFNYILKSEYNLLR